MTPPAQVDSRAVEAVQDALSAEHAAVWAYGLTTAYTDGQTSGQVSQGLGEHKAERDSTERLLQEAEERPRPPAATYRPPTPVTDQRSALELLMTAEGDVQNAWRAVLDRTRDPGMRTTACETLSAAAVRAARWRRTAGQHPYTEQFPGRR